jgi:hypothetical protein
MAWKEGLSGQRKETSGRGEKRHIRGIGVNLIKVLYIHV